MVCRKPHEIVKHDKYISYQVMITRVFLSYPDFCSSPDGLYLTLSEEDNVPLQLSHSRLSD